MKILCETKNDDPRMPDTTSSEIHKSTILLYLFIVSLFNKSKEIRRLSFYLKSDTLFETVSKTVVFHRVCPEPFQRT